MAAEPLPPSGLELDILGQQPLLKIYTQICLCYPLPDDKAHSKVINTLKRGLDILALNVPWTAGQVVTTGSSAKHSGTSNIVAYQSAPRLVVKDLRTNAWSYAALQEAKFPFRMLDEMVFCPRSTLPGMPGETEEQREVQPVMLVQASFVTGGLVLSVLAHHAVMDVTGQGEVMHLLSRACSGEEVFGAAEMDVLNRTRFDVIEFLPEDWEPGSALDHQIVKARSAAETVAVPPHCLWTYFAFSAESLAALKKSATQTLAPHQFVSTDDTLTAFIWQATARARSHRLDPTSLLSFARAVDTRRYLNVPATYPGLLQNMTYHSCTLQILLDSTLGAIALDFRRAVAPETSTLAHDTRALATLMHRTDDKADISLTASIKVGNDIMLSSWAKINCYDLEFGLGLGLPEAVRRPLFTAVENLAYVLPKRRDGELVVGICLREEDMELFKSDELVQKHSVFIG